MSEPYSTFAADCFSGRSVFITGAASGMGLETARAFASKGAEVVMADRDESGLARYSAELRERGAKIHTVTVMSRIRRASKRHSPIATQTSPGSTIW